jgi:hypothetical protein
MNTTSAASGGQVESVGLIRPPDGDLPSGEAKRSEAKSDGTARLRELLHIFRGRAPLIRQMRGQCEVRVWWSGSSDSVQGGFVLDAEILSGLVEICVGFYGTVYPDVDDARAE